MNIKSSINQTQLNAENAAMLSEMKFYLLTSAVSESKARKVLEELEDHMLLAQQDGKTFEDVFGRDPKAFCDELVKEIPKPSLWERSKLLFMAPIILLLWRLAEGIDGTLHLSLFDAGGIVIISLIIIGIFLFVLRKTSFKPYKVVYWMVLCLSFFTLMVFIGLSSVEKFILPNGPTLELQGIPAHALGAIGILLLIASLYWSTIKTWFVRK